MRASGGVYLTPAPRLSSTVRSVAITLASVNTQTMALCCVSWIFFLARCQGYCTAHMHAQLRRRCYLTSGYLLPQARISIMPRSWGATKSEYYGQRMNCKKWQNQTEVNQ